MQKLKAEVTFSIPPEYVLVTKTEYTDLKQESLSGVYWNMKDLEVRTNRKHEWLKENILFPSKFRKILDSENGGFVFYPKARGQTWSFQASKMAEFLDKNFSKIFKEASPQ